jgi:AcrR family transcriptional regulator
MAKRSQPQQSNAGANSRRRVLKLARNLAAPRSRHLKLARNLAAPRSRHKAKGKGRVREILQVGRLLFATEGYSGFTMRAIAARAGMKLGNLQHYYKTREQLLQAVLEQVMLSYDGHYLRLPGAQNGNPQSRFTAIVRFLIEDLKNPLTSGTFMELWALAERHKFAAAIMDEMYSHHRENIAALLRDLNPKLSSNKRARRAALIATQIEGLNLLLACGKPRHKELRGLEKEALRWITKLATQA